MLNYSPFAYIKKIVSIPQKGRGTWPRLVYLFDVIIYLRIK